MDQLSMAFMISFKGELRTIDDLSLLANEYLNYRLEQEIGGCGGWTVGGGESLDAVVSFGIGLVLFLLAHNHT